MNRIIIILLLVFTIACSTIQVKKVPLGESSISKIPGIPFYVKKAACVTETVWLEKVYILKLNIKAVDPKKPKESVDLFSHSKVITDSTFQSNQFKQFSKGVTATKSTNKTRDDLLELIAAFQAFPDYSFKSVLKSPEYLILVSNTSKTEVYVDYSTTYYINNKRPLIGTAKLSTEIQKDSTLAKGSSEAEYKTGDTIISALPIGDLISSILIPSKDAEAAMPVEG